MAPCCGFTRRKEHAACGPARLGVFSGRGCKCDGLLNMSYEWRPIGCKLRPWNASRFCELLHGRVLLLVGDSTMEQVAHVLRSYIRWESYGRTGDPDATCATNVHFGLSDTLTGETLGRLNRGRTLDYHVNKIRPGVSAGAHIYGEDHFDAVLRHVRDGLARKYPAVRFVWKTQGPAGCGDERPLTSLPTYDSPFWAVEHALPPTQKPRDQFNHRLFLQRDAHAKRFFGELNGSLPHRGLREKAARGRSRHDAAALPRGRTPVEPRHAREAQGWFLRLSAPMLRGGRWRAARPGAEAATEWGRDGAD